MIHIEKTFKMQTQQKNNHFQKKTTNVEKIMFPFVTSFKRHRKDKFNWYFVK